MIMAVPIHTFSKIGRGQRSEESGTNEINYDSLKMEFRTRPIYY